MADKFNVITTLELACAAFRVNGSYIKEGGWMHRLQKKDEFPSQVANKILILHSLNPDFWFNHYNGLPPKKLLVLDEDTTLAGNIEKFYRRLAFTVMDATENFSFESEVFSIFNKDAITASEIGYIACLPSLYFRDVSQATIKKHATKCENEYLGAIGQELFDRDCEILDVSKSKNFDAWNVTAVIDNMMVSWMSKQQLQIGPCVIINSRIKDLSLHWKHSNPVTRLHYVRVAQ